MAKRKRQVKGTEINIPDALVDTIKKFLDNVSSDLKNDAETVLKDLGVEPMPVSSRTQIDVCKLII